ncbi:MAG: hypothetical protein U5O39_11275 [Gammaproteobacteria bacterium]|nr:hypothetical protein [Gammaproteobacteria bacterium]
MPIVCEGRVATLVLTVNDVSELVTLRMQHARELSLFASGFVQTCAWCGRVRGGWRLAFGLGLHEAPRFAETLGTLP